MWNRYSPNIARAGCVWLSLKCALLCGAVLCARLEESSLSLYIAGPQLVRGAVMNKCIIEYVRPPEAAELEGVSVEVTPLDEYERYLKSLGVKAATRGSARPSMRGRLFVVYNNLSKSPKDQAVALHFVTKPYQVDLMPGPNLIKLGIPGSVLFTGRVELQVHAVADGRVVASSKAFTVECVADGAN